MEWSPCGCVFVALSTCSGLCFLFALKLDLLLLYLILFCGFVLCWCFSLYANMSFNAAYLNKGELVFKVKVCGAAPASSVVEFWRQLQTLMAAGTPVSWRVDYMLLWNSWLVVDWKCAVEEYSENPPSRSDRSKLLVRVGQLDVRLRLINQAGELDVADRTLI